MDIEAATNTGVWVSKIDSLKCGNSSSCAEHAIFLAIGLLRNLFELNRSVSMGRLGTPTGRTLYKSNILIYGYGNIGKDLIKRLISFEPNHIYVITKSKLKPSSYSLQSNSPHKSTTSAVSSSSSPYILVGLSKESERYIDTDNSNFTEMVTFGSPDQFSNYARHTDIVFVCCSQNDSNKGFVNKEFIECLPSNSVIVNVARVSRKGY